MVHEKSLDDQIVLVTRPRLSAETPLVDRLHAAGAGVILHPVIEIGPPADWGPVDDSIRQLSDFGTVAFLSGSGVEHFFGRFRMLAGPEGLERCKIAAIGDATAEKIRAYGETVDFIPAASNSPSMAELLSGIEAPEPILLLRANRGSDLISEHLKQQGKEFQEVVVYESHDIQKPDSKTLNFLEEGQIDWVTITSSAIARSTTKLFGEALRNAKLASISPTTTTALIEAGFSATVEATDFNFDGLVNAMSAHLDLFQ